MRGSLTGAMDRGVVLWCCSAAPCHDGLYLCVQELVGECIKFRVLQAVLFALKFAQAGACAHAGPLVHI